jgi:hypothetical protein
VEYEFDRLVDPISLAVLGIDYSLLAAGSFVLISRDIHSTLHPIRFMLWLSSW